MDVWVISMLSLVMIKKCFAVQLILKKQPSLLGLAPRDVSLYSDEEQEETAVYAGCCLISNHPSHNTSYEKNWGW